MGKVSNPYNFNPKDDYRSYSDIYKEGSYRGVLIDIPLTLMFEERYSFINAYKTNYLVKPLIDGEDPYIYLEDKKWQVSGGNTNSGIYDGPTGEFVFNNPILKNDYTINVDDDNETEFNYLPYFNGHETTINPLKENPIDIPVTSIYDELKALGSYLSKPHYEYIVYLINYINTDSDIQGTSSSSLKNDSDYSIDYSFGGDSKIEYKVGTALSYSDIGLYNVSKGSASLFVEIPNGTHYGNETILQYSLIVYKKEPSFIVEGNIKIYRKKVLKDDPDFNYTKGYTSDGSKYGFIINFNNLPEELYNYLLDDEYYTTFEMQIAY